MVNTAVEMATWGGWVSMMRLSESVYVPPAQSSSVASMRCGPSPPGVQEVVQIGLVAVEGVQVLVSTTLWPSWTVSFLR